MRRLYRSGSIHDHSCQSPRRALHRPQRDLRCCGAVPGAGLGAASGIVGQAPTRKTRRWRCRSSASLEPRWSIFLLVLSLPGLITGIGLLKFQPWARIVGLVFGAINLINIPFGTILGVYGLWVLL